MFGDREADMFGATPEGPSPETPAAEPPAGDEADPLGAHTSDSTMQSSLADANTRFEMGGQIYFRLNSTFTEDEPPGEAAWSSPSFADLFVDVRPNERVRAFTQGRLYHDFTVVSGETDLYGNEATTNRALLDQLWFKADIGRKVFFTVGRQRVKWGSGRFWNPTDFLNQTTLDPLAIFDERTGVGLVRMHVPVGTANLYAVASLEKVADVQHTGGAVRGEFIVGPAELSLSGMLQQDQPTRLGADLSTAVGLLDVHVEAAVKHGVTTPFYKGELDLDTFTLPEEYHRKDDWIPQVTAGAEISIRYNDEDSFSLGAEYFYNDAGYENSDLYPALLFGGTYTPFYLGRHYAGAYLYLGAPGQWDDTSFTASTLGNLSDETFVSRLDVRQTVLTFLNLSAYVQSAYGEKGEFFYSFTLDPIDPTFLPDTLDATTTALLTSGIDIAPTPLTVGVGAQIDF